MKSVTRKLAATMALISLTGSSAMASIVAPSVAGGSEILLSFVNNTSNDSLTMDTGLRIADLNVGSVISLSAAAQSFITSAGGLSGISYGIIAGDTSNFTTNQFLTSSTNDLTSKAVANATKGTWGNSIIQIVGNLNAGDATATNVNNTYGPFADSVGSPNYRAGGHDLWQTGDTALSNLALGTSQTDLYKYTLSGFSGTANAQKLIGPLQLTNSSVSVVPIPAAVWLMASALVSLFGAGRRNLIKEAAAMLKDRLTLRAVDLI
jgi:hypothetical protein